MPPSYSEPGPPDRLPDRQATLDPAPLVAWRARAQDIDPNFVQELVKEFLSDMATQLAILEHATTTGDSGACRSIAHRMQSSCTAIGAFRLATLFEEMELLAKNNVVPFLGSQCAKIQAEYARLKPLLEQQRF